MSFDAVVRLAGVSKCYRTFRKPLHRLVQLFSSRRRLYEEFWALRDVDLAVVRGETLGIVGQNGSGKSTLLQLVVGTLSPTSGTVNCDGRISAILELGAGFNPEFTGIENARLNAAIVGMSHEEIDERMPAILAFSELGEFIDKPVKTYSSGMYIRLAFSVIINMDPDILVIDEALAVGDSRFQRKCFRKLDELRNAGTTILFVTHATDAVIAHCDRAVFMRDGRVVTVGDPKEVVNNYLESMFESGANIAGDQRAAAADGLDDRRLSTDPSIDACSLRPTYNDTEYEWGDGGARIIDYLVLDDDGEPVRGPVAAGSRIAVRAAVHYREAQSGVIYGLTIKTVDGTSVFGTNSDRLKVDAGAPAAGETVIVTFSLALHLIGSEYFFSLGVVAGRGGMEHEILHRRYDLFRLKVQDDNSAFGYAALPARIEIQRQESAQPC